MGNLVPGEAPRLVKPETCIFISFFRGFFSVPADTSVIDNMTHLGEFMEYVSFLFVLVVRESRPLVFVQHFKSVPSENHMFAGEPQDVPH